jgi:hypothetical protein
VTGFSRVQRDPQRYQAVGALYRSIRLSNVPEVRGVRLLRRWLSPEQLEQFNTRGFFDVIGGHTARRYRIYYPASQNVELLGPLGVARERYCFVPDDDLVPGDVMLAQKVALENDETGALAVAIRLPPYSPAHRRRSQHLIPVA